MTAVLAAAAPTATVDELVAQLAAHGAPPAVARTYVESLVDAQLLVPDLQPPVTGPPPLGAMHERLAPYPAATPVRGVLAEVARRLADLDKEGINDDRGAHIRVAALLADLPAPRPAHGRLFQVDMARPTRRLHLSEDVVEELLRGVARLQLLTSPAPDPLAGLRTRFRQRYEEAPVPLLQAFDDEPGIGLNSLPKPSAGGEAGRAAEHPDVVVDATTRWGAREDLLANLVVTAAKTHASEIVLTDADLQPLAAAPHPPLPASFAVMATLLAESAAAVSSGNYLALLTGAFGPSGARMLARFCGTDPLLRAHVERHLREEESTDPDAVFAEVAHLPASRLGNVVHRPLLRRYEIDYLGPSGAPEDRRIPLSDLTVGLVGDRFELWSQRLQRRVVPRVSSAVGFHLGVPPLFRFLGLLQTQGGSGGLSFSWGPLRRQPFLPRLRVGRTVLALARWRLDASDLVTLRGRKPAARYTLLQRLRHERGLPRFVAALGDRSGFVLVDLDNVLSCESFLHLHEHKTEATLMEFAVAPDRLCVTGPEGGYVHELLVPFVTAQRAGAPSRSGHPLRRRSPVTTTARLPPGSEWLYAKLYGGRVATERVLQETLGPRVLRRREVDRWFFVRYADPDPHLRVRLHGDGQVLQGTVLPALQAVAADEVASGRLWRVAFDTYEREVDRYGGARGVDIAERVFHVDSDAVLELLASVRDRDRFRTLAVLGVESLLACFHVVPADRHRLLREMIRSLLARAEPDEISLPEIGRQFRRWRPELEQNRHALRSGPSEDAALDVLRQRAERLAPLGASLLDLERRGQLAAPVAEIAMSLAHMHVNRMLRAPLSRHEVAIYDALARSCSADAARGLTGSAIGPEPSL